MKTYHKIQTVYKRDPEVELEARNGQRIITKIKCKDFE